MITIKDNTVFITLYGTTRLVQTHHSETGKRFQSEAECHAWIKESGWFERLQQQMLHLLKQQASHEIKRAAPTFKQINAALGIYSKKQRVNIKRTIKQVRKRIKKQEQALLKLNDLNELLALWSQFSPSAFNYNATSKS